MNVPTKRILWVDDEIDLLGPHLLFLRQRGYQVDLATNGDDALVMLRDQAYDLVLLDEQMPGRRGLEVLAELRREEPSARVVMVTKSEEDRTLVEAIGRRVDDYLVKPTNPRQVLSVVTRLLEGPQLRQQQAAQDFAARFPELARSRADATGWRDYVDLFDELVTWELRLHEAREAGLVDSVHALLAELRRGFGALVVREYGTWTAAAGEPLPAGTLAPARTSAVAAAPAGGERPPLSTDIVARHVVPELGGGPVLFMVLDCLRLDQWRVLRPLLTQIYDIHESLYLSILPTATPYSRNALFSGSFPDVVARGRPGWWGQEEGSLNAFEDELFRGHLRQLTGREVPVHYEKVFSESHGEEVVSRVRGVLRRDGSTAEERVITLVFNFVDMLTHGRSESPVLYEVARDASALRGLTRQWFEGSSALRILRDAAAAGVPTIMTTDHGSILCERPLTVYARKDATSNLRYKFGVDLRAERPSAVFAVNDERVLRFPPGRMAMNYLLALEDHFFVYPTKLREYQNRYRGSFLHGGVSPEEMILPVALLTPR